MSTAGLSEVVRDGRLRHRIDGQIVPFAPTLFDDELLSAVDAATAAWIPLAVVLPLPATATAVTLGAAATLSAVTRARRLDVTTAVISKQLSHRALYDQLHLEQQRLREFIPRARLGADGRISTVGRARHDNGGRLLLTSDLSRLSTLTDLHALVLDATAVAVRALPPLLERARTGTTVVYLTGNPLDPGLAAVRAAGGVVWSWDIDDLAPLAAPIRLITLPDSRRTGAPPPRGALAASAELLTATAETRRALWLPDDATGSASGRDGRRRAAQAAADRQLDTALAELWRSIGRLAATYRPGSRPAAVQSAGSSAVTGPLSAGAAMTPADLAMRWVWSLFNTLSLLPVDPARYDTLLPATPWATRLTDAPEQARTYARNTPSALTDPWLRVADALEQVLHAAAPAPKLTRVLTWVASLIDDPTADPLRATVDPQRLSAHSREEHSAAGATAPSRSLIITRNRTCAAAVAAVLDEHPDVPLGWGEHVQVASLPDILTGRVATSGHLLLCGAVPKSAAGLLAMPAASSITVLAAGSWEGTRVVSTSGAASAELRRLRTETVTLSAPRLGVAPHRTDLFGPEAGLTAVSGGHTRALPTHPEAPAWEPFDADLSAMLTRISSAMRDDLPAPPVRQDHVSVPAICVWLRDASPASSAPADSTAVATETAAAAANSVVLLAADDLIHRRRGTSLAQVAAKSVQADDLLVLIDHSARADLFTTITARLGELPEYLPILALVEMWQAHAASARDSGRNYEQILAALQADGSAITSADTVGSWIRGQVHGPADPDDIGRFAAAVGDQELARRARSISAAVRALNATHRKVGMWLSGQISSALDRDDPEQLVDVTLDVHVSDLLESVTQHPVVTVDLDARPVPAALTATVLPPDVARSYGFPSV